LAVLGKNLETHHRRAILEKLVDLLRDSWHRVAWAAMQALGALGDPAAIPALETFAASRSVQEQAAVHRVIEALRSKDQVDGSAQKKQVEDLRDKVRELEHQVQSLSARLELDRENLDDAFVPAD
jgi:HEAT repeat protein